MSSGPIVYEIRVAESLDQHWVTWFPGMEILELPEGGTLIKGVLPDQAALFGVLSKVRDLNLTVFEVKRIDKTTYY